jgi:hypothetical protein
VFISNIHPKLGAILIRGGVENYRFDFSNENDAQTQFDFYLDFPARGENVFISVEYIGNEGCFSVQNRFVSPPSCSENICDVLTDLGALVAGNQASLGWLSVPNGTTYEYQYRVENSKEWHGQWVDKTEVTICDLELDKKYEYRIRSLCKNQEKSTYIYGGFSTENHENPCPNELANSGTCTIQNIEVLKIRKCHDRGTVRADDDFFIADILVIFTNPPPSGVLKISGNANETIAVGVLAYLHIYRFSDIKLSENNSLIDLTATFSGVTNCSYSIQYPIPANPCWSGKISNNKEGNSVGASKVKTKSKAANIALKLGANPVQNRLDVSYKLPPQPANGQLLLYDLFGKPFIQRQLKQKEGNVQLDIQDLRNGVYYLTLQHGGRNITQKVVKQDLE